MKACLNNKTLVLVALIIWSPDAIWGQENNAPFEALAAPSQAQSQVQSANNAPVNSPNTKNINEANMGQTINSDDEFSGAENDYTLDDFSTAVQGEDDLPGNTEFNDTESNDTQMVEEDLFLPEGENTVLEADDTVQINNASGNVNTNVTTNEQTANTQIFTYTNKPGNPQNNAPNAAPPSPPVTQQPAQNMNAALQIGDKPLNAANNSFTPPEPNTYSPPPPPVPEPAAVPVAAPVSLSETPYTQPPIILNEAPLLPGSIKELNEAEAPAEYTIERGDTLYDICEQLINKPSYWPKLWALNPHIKNPHFLMPGVKIKFFNPSSEVSPHLEILPQEDIPIAAENIEQIILGELIPPIHVAASTTGILSGEELDALANYAPLLLTAGKVYKSNDLITRVPAFVYEDEKEPVGYVYAGTEGNNLLNFGEKMLIEIESKIDVGALYSILREDESYDGEGYLYYNAGTVKVSQILADEDMAIGLVTETMTGIKANDIIVPYISSVRVISNISQVGSLSDTDAEIVAFEKMEQEIGADGNFVVLNRGARSGITPNQYYVIRQRAGYWSMNRSVDIDNFFENVGIVRIIDSTPTGSVGYVVKTNGEIRRGDLVGTKQM